MHHIEQKLAEFSLARPIVAIVIPVLVIIALSTGISRLTFDSDYRSYFKPDDPGLLAWDALAETFTETNSLVLMLSPRDGDIFTRENLAAVEYVTAQAWKLPFAIRVDSLSNYQHTRAEGDDLIVADLARDAENLTDAELLYIRQIALAEPLLVNRTVSPDGAASGINIRVPLGDSDKTPAFAELSAAIDQLRADFEQRFPEVKLYAGGEFMIDLSFMIAAKRDASTLLPLSFLVMTILLMILLRSITATLLTLLVITLSVVAAFGLRGYSGIPLTGQSGSVPIIVMTVAIANCVHIVVSFIHGLNLGQDKKAALQESLRVNLQPVFVASLTTTLGFLTLNAAEAPPIGWMGNTVACGVAVSFLLSITLLPAGLQLLPFKSVKRKESAQQWLERLGHLLVKHRDKFLLGTSIVIAGICALVPLNRIESDPFAFFDRSFEVRRATDFLAENLSGPLQIDYQLKSSGSGQIAEPAFLADAEKFAIWLRQQPEVVQVSSLTDTLKRLNANMHGDDPVWYKLPTERDMTAQYLLLYEMSLPYGLDLNDQIDVERSSIRTAVALRKIDGPDLMLMEERVQEWLAENVQHFTSRGQGVQYLFHRLAIGNIVSLLWGAVAALVVISLLLTIAFRSAKFGLLSLVPNLVPAAMGFGAWAFLSGKIGLDISMVVGMTLGIVVDDTVHFVSKYLRARRENHLSSEQAVVYAFTTVGKALLVTSMVLVAGFLVLSMSGFAFNSRMAMLTAMVIVFAILVDFLFLPALLMKTDRARA